MSGKAKDAGPGGQQVFHGKFLIRNRLGLHARAAAVLVQVARRFDSEITVAKDDLQVNGKSIMAVLQLAAVQGESIEITAQGGDGAEAIAAIGRLIEQLFGEED